MKFRALGSTGFDVSTVSLGTWTIGGGDWGRVDDRDSIKAIRRAADLGVNLFDTAPIYGNGHAETVLGAALEGIRDTVYVATKCGPWEDELGRLRLDLSREGIFRQVDDSLRRLKTDRIDLLQVHWNDTIWPVDQTMETLRELVKTGRIRAFGVSNFSMAELAQAVEGGCASLQSPYSVMNTDVEKDILPLCGRSGTGFLAYEPLCRGLLAGKYGPGTRFEPGDVRLQDPRFRGAAFRENLDRVEKLRRIADSCGLDPAACAIAWVCHNPVVTTAICGARTATQAAANAKAADVELDDQTTARLRALFNP